MRKLFAVILVLAFAVPSMGVNFTLIPGDAGSGKLTVAYDLQPGEVVRGMALKITVQSGDATIYGNTDVIMGPLPDQLKYVFPDYAFTQGIGYSIGTGNPLAESPAAGILTTYPSSQFSVCFGILDDGGNQAGLTVSSFFDIFFTMSTDSVVKVEEDTLRGGIVGDNIVASNLPLQEIYPLHETITTPTVAKTTAAPATATRVNGGRVETFVASGATCSLGHSLEYQFTWGDGATSPWGPATQTHTYIYTADGIYNVTAQARCVVHPTIVSGVSAPLALTREAVKATAPFYQAWAATFLRPSCWAYKRNCRGDVDNRGSGIGPYKQWVNNVDLQVLAAAFNQPEYKLVSIIVGTPYGGIAGICADNNRQYTGFGSNRIWVNNADLSTFSNYYNKAEASVPPCAQTNYHFWY